MSAASVEPKPSIPAGLNGTLTAGALAAVLFSLLGTPVLVRFGWGWAVPAVASPWLTALHWGLMHEAMHGLLHPKARPNERLGRALAVAFGVPFYLVRFGHLVHHRHNRFELDRPEIFDSSRTARLLAAPGYYLRLCGGLFLGEAVAVPLFLLPRVRLRQLAAGVLGGNDPKFEGLRRQAMGALSDEKLSRIRTDSALTLLLYGASLWLYGALWPLLAAQVLMRGFLISVLDNAFHYGTSIHSGRAALNFSLPPGLARAMLNFNYHHAHHAQPSLPWNALPSVDPALRRFDKPLWTGIARQFKGPIAFNRIKQTSASET